MVVRAVLCSKGGGLASAGGALSRLAPPHTGAEATDCLPRANVARAGMVAQAEPARLRRRQPPCASLKARVSASRQDLFDRLAGLGITTETLEHPAVFTVAESSRLERQLPGGHTKNLFLKDKKDRLFLVVALGDAHIELKSLHRALGCDRLSFGKPELLIEVLGVAPGSVTPFALINDTARRVTVILDADMMRHERLNYHPLQNTATTNIARQDLLTFIRSCGHEPRIAAVASPGETGLGQTGFAQTGS